MSSIWTVRRSATDVKLTGLCGGVARHWGVDPVLVRVGCALLALSGGIGVVLYLAGWLLIPVEGRDRSPVDDFFGANGRRWPKEVWIALVVVACITVFTLFGSVSPFGVGPAVVLAVIWYFGFYRGRKSGSTPTGDPTALPPAQPPQFVRYPGPPTPFTEAAEAWRLRIEENARQAASWTPPPEPTTWPTPTWPAPPTGDLAAARTVSPTEPDRGEPRFEPSLDERRAFLATADPVGLYTETPAPVRVLQRDTKSAHRLRLVALILIGLALTALGVLDGQGVAIPTAAYFGTALLGTGLTLVAATWLGRARGLLPVGLVLALGLLVTSAVSPAADLDQWSTTTVAYSRVADLPAGGDSRDVGQLRVDLSRLPVTSDLAYRAHVDAGPLVVTVPADVNVVVNYRVDLGRVRAYGREVSGGTDLSGVQSEPAPPVAHRPTLTLDLSVDAGELEVSR